MKAWRLTMATGSLEFADVPAPVARPGSVVVRVEAAPVVSYLREYVAGRLPDYDPPPDPFTPGTSAVGVVEEVGAEVYGLRPGQRVVATGHYTSAENVAEPAQALLGITAPPGSGAVLETWRDGTFAEQVVAPVSTVTPLPAALDGIGGAALIGVTRCLVPYGGLLRGRLQAGETVVVNGATGGFGSAGVTVAVAMGARRVVAAGRTRAVLERLSTQNRVVTVALSGDVEADAEALRRAAGAPIDLGLDLVGGAGDPESTLASLAALRRGGRQVLMGSMTAALPIDYTGLMMTGKEVIGNFMYPRSAPGRLLELVAAGLLDLDGIPTEHFPLAALREAMDRAAHSGAPLVAVGG
ncbi:alcohol dehydrogenase catalytic domain-containing protein [Pseudonocardia sp. CA-107938]|uniref:alcohol dehydrogenase catalytic domain-containing protein n=1 Tax=Pseudonocardia sp. CA-107938 TaxID=3240021 RepID=UPI003D8CF8D4